MNLKTYLPYLAILLVALLLSCEDDTMNQDKGFYSASFYKGDEFIFYQKESGNMRSGALSGGPFGTDYMHMLTMEVGDFSDESEILHHKLRIELVNMTPNPTGEVCPYDEHQFRNFLSARSIEYLDVPDYKDITKEGVVIVYTDRSGEIWTSSDFNNKFRTIDEVYPALNYSSFEFRILHSEKATSNSVRYAQKLKILFHCQMINRHGEIQEFNFGEVELRYDYPKVW